MSSTRPIPASTFPSCMRRGSARRWQFGHGGADRRAVEPISARAGYRAAVRAATKAIAGHHWRPPCLGLPGRCWTAQAGRSPIECRESLVVTDLRRRGGGAVRSGCCKTQPRARLQARTTTTRKTLPSMAAARPARSCPSDIRRRTAGTKHPASIRDAAARINVRSAPSSTCRAGAKSRYPHAGRCGKDYADELARRRFALILPHR